MVDPECILILVDPGPWHNELPVLSRQPARGAAMVAKVPCNLTPRHPPRGCGRWGQRMFRARGRERIGPNPRKFSP
jgi:hypothetical protein